MAQMRAKNGDQIRLNGELSQQVDRLWQKRPGVRKLLEEREGLLRTVRPSLLQGNLHMGNIYVYHGKYTGLADYTSLLLGAPVNDLAYCSVMPRGEEFVPYLRRGWEKVMWD